MARSVPWQRTSSDIVNWRQDQALNATFFILREFGPTGFLLKEDETENKKYKVYLGDPHTCTCHDFQKDKQPCKHICWVLLKKFRIPRNDPVTWQLGLVEREINAILKGLLSTPMGGNNTDKNKSSKKERKSEDTDGIRQRVINDEDICPICQEEFFMKRLPVTFCRNGCGNNVHIKCMKVWADHQHSTQNNSNPSSDIKCPLCREIFGPYSLICQEFQNTRTFTLKAKKEGLDLEPSSVQLSSDKTSETSKQDWLPLEIINKLPVFRIPPNSKLLLPGQQCRICLRPFSSQEFVRKLICGHKYVCNLNIDSNVRSKEFHRDCIDKILKSERSTCPLDGKAVWNPFKEFEKHRSVLLSEKKLEKSESEHNLLAIDAIGLTVKKSSSADSNIIKARNKSQYSKIRSEHIIATYVKHPNSEIDGINIDMIQPNITSATNFISSHENEPPSDKSQSLPNNSEMILIGEENFTNINKKITYNNGNGPKLNDVNNNVRKTNTNLVHNRKALKASHHQHGTGLKKLMAINGGDLSFPQGNSVENGSYGNNKVTSAQDNLNGITKMGTLVVGEENAYGNENGDGGVRKVTVTSGAAVKHRLMRSKKKVILANRQTSLPTSDEMKYPDILPTAKEPSFVAQNTGVAPFMMTSCLLPPIHPTSDSSSSSKSSHRQHQQQHRNPRKYVRKLPSSRKYGNSHSVVNEGSDEIPFDDERMADPSPNFKPDLDQLYVTSKNFSRSEPTLIDLTTTQIQPPSSFNSNNIINKKSQNHSRKCSFPEITNNPPYGADSNINSSDQPSPLHPVSNTPSEFSDRTVSGDSLTSPTESITINFTTGNQQADHSHNSPGANTTSRLRKINSANSIISDYVTKSSPNSQLSSQSPSGSSLRKPHGVKLPSPGSKKHDKHRIRKGRPSVPSSTQDSSMLQISKKFANSVGFPTQDKPVKTSHSRHHNFLQQYQQTTSIINDRSKLLDDQELVLQAIPVNPSKTHLQSQIDSSNNAKSNISESANSDIDASNDRHNITPATDDSENNILETLTINKNSNNSLRHDTNSNGSHILMSMIEETSQERTLVNSNEKERSVENITDAASSDSNEKGFSAGSAKLSSGSDGRAKLTIEIPSTSFVQDVSASVDHASDESD